LPSKDELNKLYVNRVAIGGFINSYYWSSTENDNDNAWAQTFVSGSQDYLTKFVTFYVRAVRAFPAAPVLPALSTTAASAITSTTATSGGNILADGGAAVTARGVCWGTTTGPTTSSSKTIDGSGAGVFSSSITGLASGTTYYVRAYATNDAGTAYGNELSFTTSLLVIGDSYQGGVVAYILQSGDTGYDPTQPHGLIAAQSDQSTGAEWGCFGTTITGADGSLLGTGLQNTIDIMAGCTTAGIAARLCRGVTINGYSDWYLPSKDELVKLYLSKAAIGGFSLNYYWSSTEFDINGASCQTFADGTLSVGLKTNPERVRAVRAF
jgi:hypothetical protein